MIDVSLVILTWNRWRSVSQSLSANIERAGYPIREIVHVDNGSDEPFTNQFKITYRPSVQVINESNQGVAKGYNRGLALATSSHVVITGCDRVLPHNWLKTWVRCFETIPNTGVVSCYTGPYEERIRGNAHDCQGITIQRAIPVEARMHSRSFLHLVGFFREDFGVYGYEDSEWSDRAEKRARENGLINYIVPEMGLAEHLPDDDFGPEYAAWKKTVHADPLNKALWLDCHQRNSPHYNPYARLEPDVRQRLKDQAP